MQDNPEGREALITTMAEITTLLESRGIVGSVVLALRGQSETQLLLKAPWSVASVEYIDGRGRALRIRSKGAEYVGRAEQQRVDLGDTLSAVESMGRLAGMHAMALLESVDMARAVVKIEEETPLQPVHKQ